MTQGCGTRSSAEERRGRDAGAGEKKLGRGTCMRGPRGRTGSGPTEKKKGGKDLGLRAENREGDFFFFSVSLFF